MGGKTIIILYNAVLVADHENDLQRLLHQFNHTLKYLAISAHKIKCMTSTKPLRCKLELERITIQQESTLGKELSGYGKVEAEVRKQV